jgi:membrane-associated PAP2 superfamily phosphatase
VRAARVELGWLAAALALIFLLARYTPLDHALTGLFYDPAAQRFPLKDQAFWAMIMHTGLKYLGLAVWFGLLLWWISLRRKPSRRPLCRAFGFTLIAAPLAALSVSALRAVSAHSCPWDLSLFGGTAEYFRFFDAVPLNPGPGRCAPSGHAASGFAWFAAYAGLRGVDRRAAHMALAFALLLGTLTGITQLARGAHFVSHILLTAWICFAVALVLDRIGKTWTRRMADVQPGNGKV